MSAPVLAQYDPERPRNTMQYTEPKMGQILALSSHGPGRTRTFV